MAKKKTWFSIIKSFFISEPQSRLEKKDKRKRWAFRSMKMKLAPLSTLSPARERLPWQQTAAEQCNNNSSAVPVIVAIDNAQSAPHQHKDSQESVVEGNSCAAACVISVQISHQHENTSQHHSATKIQASFRGYLARKALRALKGVVKLQALIRGWAVRQQAINTLKCLQSIVNIQSEVCSKRCERIKDNLYCQENKSQDFREKDIKILVSSLFRLSIKWHHDPSQQCSAKFKVDLNCKRRWKESTLTKEELKDLFLTKKETSIKRERNKEYYLNHRRSAETEREKVHGRQRYWLEQWVDAQLAKSDNSRNSDEEGSRLPDVRRSYHHMKQCSTGNDNSLFPGSPSIPAYMASTESAKAKARSLSSPRLRPLSFDVCSEITSPYKHKISPISSINSELTSSSWFGNHLSLSRSSPGLKGVPRPIKSTISTKDLRVRGIHRRNDDEK